MSLFERLNSSIAAIALAGVVALASANAQADQIITLHSGNGTVGGVDSAITFLAGPANSGFASPFTATDFANASAGPAARIITPNGAWGALPPPAQWIGTNATAGTVEGPSALYAINFAITDAVVTSATLNFDFLVDNILGSVSSFGSDEGLFINGVALAGSSGGGFAGTFNFTSGDISSLLTTGVNTLYINVTDVGGPAGLLFNATITTTGNNDAPVPAPGALGLLGLGLAALGAIRRRRTV
jgi:MYXO-CTERM domain-containing protein